MRLAMEEDRNLLSRMVRSGPSRITTMVGSDHEQVIALQSLKQFGKPPVKCFESRGVAGHVSPMAIHRVEIDEIGEYQSAVCKLFESPESAVEQCIIVAAFVVAADRTVGKYISDLADRDDVAGFGFGKIEDGRAARRYGEVTPPGGSLEAFGCRSLERPGDDTPNVEGVDQPAGNLTDVIKAIEPERLLMCCDLENTVGRCVTDGFPGPQMLRTQTFDDLRSGGVAVPEHAGKFCFRA